MSMTTRATRATLLALALVGALVLTSCTPSGYVGARGTVAIQARKLGIALSSTSVSCKPVTGDQFLHRCTAPVGAGGASVTLTVRVGSVVTPTQKIERVVSTIPASLARGSLKRTEKDWTYSTSCGWEEGSDGVWRVDPTVPPRTFLVDENGQGVKEI